jgi:hypothetical protein
VQALITQVNVWMKDVAHEAEQWMLDLCPAISGGIDIE